MPALRASVLPFRRLQSDRARRARSPPGSRRALFKLGAAAHDASHAGLLGWDARWYERIAAHGYAGLGNAALRFFPLLPVLARSLRAVPGMTAGMSVIIVANVASLAAFAVLYRLVVFELGDEACARRAVWLLALAPPAFVLVMGYAESLLLVTSLVAFLGLRQRRYGLAICAALRGRALPARRDAAGDPCRDRGGRELALAQRSRAHHRRRRRARGAGRSGGVPRLGAGGGRELPAPAARAALTIAPGQRSPIRSSPSPATRATLCTATISVRRSTPSGPSLLFALAVFIVLPAPGRLRLVHRRRARGRADGLQPRVARAIRARLLPVRHRRRDAHQEPQELTESVIGLFGLTARRLRHAGLSRQVRALRRGQRRGHATSRSGPPVR